MSKHCRWSSLVLSLAASLAAPGNVHAQATGALKPAASATPQAVQASRQDKEAEEELYLDVTLNSVAAGQLARFVRRRGALHASAETLKALGLKPPPGASGLVALADLPGLQQTFSEADLRLALLAPLALLDRPLARIDAQLPARALVDPATQVPGLVVNYDLFAQEGGGQKSVSAFSEARLFGVGPGVYSNTMTSRAESGVDGVDGVDGVVRHKNLRLDTTWQRNFPDDAVSLTVGDLSTGALSWSRATRLGGFRLSSNFALQPYRITTPLAAFAGSAVLPSTVDLFVNGLKQSSQAVQPGQFQLSGIPSLGGAGQAQMVITDINGQSRTVSFDLYGAPQLLKAGLSEWSLDLGTVRRDYGLKSFSYSGAMASASGRYGLSDRSTLEAHAEAGAGVLQAGGGGVWLLGQQAGVFSASLAASGQSGQAAAGEADNQGTQHALGYQWNSQRYTVSLNALRRSIGFRDVASPAGLAGETASRGSDSAYAGVSTRDWGQFGVNLIRQSYFNAQPVRYLGLGWSYALPGNANLNLNINRNLDEGGSSSIYLSWSMPLEKNTTVSATVRRAGNSTDLLLDAAQPPPGDAGGWGWRVQAGLGDSSSAQGQVGQLGRYGQWTAGVSQLGGQGGAPASRTVYGSANGGVVLMQGSAYPVRRVDDAFVLVSTSGVPGVPVRLENRVVGETDARGMLFVTRLNAYQKNQLGIDTLNLPADMRIAREAVDAVPESRSGMLLHFDLRRILALQLSLRDAQGQWLPAGSPVWLDGPGAGVAAQTSASSPASSVAMVGYDGLVYLEDPAPGAVLRVQLAGGVCRAALPAALQAGGELDIGVLTCQ